MDNRINLETLVTRLEENELLYKIISWPNGLKMVITQRGGRLFGPFLDQKSPSLFWMNKSFSDQDAFQQFLKSGDWNLGGDRVWIAPEIQYSILDRTDFSGTLYLQQSIDPGNYQLESHGSDGWHLSQEFSLEARVLAHGSKDLRIDRYVKPVDDPLRNLSIYSELVHDILFAGYEQIVSLEEKSKDDIVSEVWSLIQVNPGGMMLIPASPCVEYTDYLNPVDDSIIQIYRNYASLKICGVRQYKLGFKAPHVYGRLGYLNSIDHERSYLIVRNFYNNPSSYYSEEVDRLPGNHGHSIHIYNDDGGLGGFGELECNGQTIGGITGKSTAAEQLLLWIYIGETEKIERIALHLLGITIEEGVPKPNLRK
jgi:hypothetical protein